MHDRDADYVELSRHLRELALRLVSQDATADDVVQEAWLVALDEPPERIRNLNAWLRKVVRNVAYRTHRRSRRHRELEGAAARPDVVESAAGAVYRASTRDLLHASLASLREPYRTVLTLRFLEELGVDEVARRVGRSRGTVRSQVRRGLAELRLELDRKHGGRREAWLSSVALLASDGRRESPPAVPVGGSALAVGGVVAASLIAVSGLVWLLLQSSERGPGSPGSEVARAEALREHGGEELVGPRSRPRSTRPARGESSPPSEDPPPPASAVRKLEVVVLKPDGSPPEDAVVRVGGRDGKRFGDYPADTNGHVTVWVPEVDLIGAPRIPGPVGGVSVAARGSREAWSYEHVARLPPEGRVLEVRTRGPAQTLRVVVEDEAGQRIPHASVFLYGGHGRQFTADGHPLGDQPTLVTLDERGELVLEWRSRRLYRMRASAPTFAAVERTFQSSTDTLEARFVLPPGGTVHGQVREGGGRPAAGARVWEPDLVRVMRGGEENGTTTDQDGFFELGGLAPGRHRLYACSAEDPEQFAATVLDVPEGQRVAWGATLARTPPVAVRVLDENGDPIADAVVVLSNEDPDLPWASLLHTDQDGRAAFLHAAPGSRTLLVRRSNATNELVTEHGVPDAQAEAVGRLAPRVAPAGLRGVVLDTEDEPFWEAVVYGAFGKETFCVPVSPSTGVFEVKDLTPGEYTLTATSYRGVFPLGTHTVLPGASYELETVRIAAPRSSARLEWVDALPSPESPWVLTCTIPGQRTRHPIRVLEEPVGGLALWPGTYGLAPSSAEDELTSFEVTPDSSTAVRVEQR